MSLNKPILEELPRESASTQRMLARIPESHWNWSPHPQSMTMARLASHIAELPMWMVVVLTRDEFNLDGHTFGNVESPVVAEEKFVSDVAEFQSVLEAQSDDHLTAPWRMTKGGEVILEMPRIALVRTMFLNHLYHHRGQLSVYLRLCGAPVPAVYGPTADENA